MSDFTPAIFLGGAALVLYFRYRLKRSRPSDDEAIDALMRAGQLQKISVTRNDNYWRYWLRGSLFSISNCARIYVVVAESPGGHRWEIHVAFDDWPPGTGELEVLMERKLPLHKGDAGRSGPTA